MSPSLRNETVTLSYISILYMHSVCRIIFQRLEIFTKFTTGFPCLLNILQIYLLNIQKLANAKTQHCSRRKACYELCLCWREFRNICDTASCKHPYKSERNTSLRLRAHNIKRKMSACEVAGTELCFSNINQD